MLLKNNLLLLSFLTFFTSFSQSNKYEFIGVLKTEEKNVISFKINFISDDNGNIEGTSITDFFGPNSTTSSIIGTINTKNNTFSFHEVSNIKTKSKAKDSEFCYVHAENIAIKSKSDKTIISGTFKGKFQSGKECVNGTLYLAGADLMEKYVSKDDLNNLSSAIDSDTANLESLLMNMTKTKALTSDEKVKLNWKSDKIKLVIWDSFSEDHDKVSIYLNDELVQKEVDVVQKKKTFEFKFPNKNAILKIVALNEGSAPPNTISALLMDGNKSTPIMTKLKIGEVVYLELSK